MNERVLVTFQATGKRQNLTAEFTGFDVIPLRRRGGVELLEAGRIQLLKDEVYARPQRGNMQRSEDVVAEKSKRRRSRRYPGNRTKLEQMTVQPGGKLFLVPQDTLDRFVHNGRVFPSMVVEVVHR
jgi:hypothetical protein